MSTAQQPPPVRGTERQQWSAALVGFYLSCAGVALGAAIAAAGFLWFGSVAALVFGSAMTLTCCLTCYRSLVSARR